MGQGDRRSVFEVEVTRELPAVYALAIHLADFVRSYVGKP